MKLGVLTAAWRRPAITRIVLEYYAALVVPGIELVRVVAVSPEGQTPDVPGWITVEADNEPLSDKWNAGMLRMKEEAPDAVMIAGSDDLISAAYVRDACDSLTDRIGLVLFDTLHCLEVATGACIRAKPPRLGAGRVLSRALLDRLGWQPWPQGLGRRLDGGMDARIVQANNKAPRPHLRAATLHGGKDRIVLDLKTDENMWSFSDMARFSARDVDAAAFLKEHFPGQAEALLA